MSTTPWPTPQKLNEGNVEFHFYFGDHRTLWRRTAALLLCADIWRRKIKGEKMEDDGTLTFNMVNLMLKIPEARRYWIKDARRKSFSHEIHGLQQGKKILPESKMRMYNPRLGLGLRSFLLVIHYRNYKAINAGILTFITNRLGEGS